MCRLVGRLDPSLLSPLLCLKLPLLELGVKLWLMMRGEGWSWLPPPLGLSSLSSIMCLGLGGATEARGMGFEGVRCCGGTVVISGDF